jgi:hypothetical protein
MDEIHIHGNVENSNIVQGDHNTLSLGAAKVHYSDSKVKVDTSASLVYVTAVTDNAIPVLWDQAEALTAAGPRPQSAIHLQSQCFYGPFLLLASLSIKKADSSMTRLSPSPSN